MYQDEVSRDFQLAPNSTKYLRLSTPSWSQRILYVISLARWKQTRKMQQWSKEGKKEVEGKFHACIPVSLAVLGLFQTPKDAVEGLNVSTQVV